ncbi:MAG TPA: DinB family protein [Candidatus Eisenbacteria bacterium]
MSTSNYRRDEAARLLEATPGLLDAWLRNLPESWLAANEGEGTWSPIDIVGHLIHGEEADWIPRARHLLDHGESKPWEPFDRFGMFTKFGGWSMPRLLDRFAEARAESLVMLTSWQLAEADLDRSTLHPEFGVVTLRQHLATWVAHDLNHVAQIARVMAGRYRGDAGPWSAYLPILKHRDQGSSKSNN